MSKRPDSIELYKPWDPKKVTKFGVVSQKLDGVPMRTLSIGGHLIGFSRQWERINTVPQIVAYAKQLIKETGGSLVGELYVDGMDFKDISGLVRRDKPDAETEKLVWYLHDADITNQPNAPYSFRMATAIKALAELRERLGVAEQDFPIRFIPFVPVRSPVEAEAAFAAIMLANPKAEGAMWHDLNKTFDPGKRKWTGLKMLKKPTIDILITGFEEAVDKFGNPKGMVGRLKATLNVMNHKCELTSHEIGVGPGKLSHAERKLLWAQFIQGKFIPRIAQVQYKVDDSYAALREPTFQFWRDDKDEPDVRQLSVA